MSSLTPAETISQDKGGDEKMAKRLKSYGDCRRFLAWVVNEVLANRMESRKASKLTYVVNGVVKILETQDLERLKTEMQELQDKEDVYE